MNYISELNAATMWLRNDVFPPAELIRNFTFIAIAFSLGSFQSWNGQKARRRSLLASQLLDALRSLKRFSLERAEARPEVRAEGLDRLLRLLGSANGEPGLLTSKQIAALEAFKHVLNDYRQKFEARKNIVESERSAWHGLAKSAWALIVALDSAYPKDFGLQQNLLGNLTIVEGEIPT
jgi:hypothetical protein